jgi:cytochrome P450
MFHNITRRGIQLSDGTYLPPRTYLTSATLAASMDASNFPNPDTFDPYRFLKMRQRSEEEAGKHQFVTLTKDMISFGYGRHACPGRFFAANEIKIIFINILKRFDVETREGEVNFLGQPELFFREVKA